MMTALREDVGENPEAEAKNMDTNEKEPANKI
jgi:hypothetical protein